MRTLSQSLPFVLLFVSDASALGHTTRNLNTVKSIYNLTVYPNNFPIVLNGSSAAPAGLFNQNVTGRVSPVGNFSGFEDSIEYFFGLAPVPTPPTYQAFYKAEVVEFTSGCSDVAASVVYLSAAQVDPDTGTKVSGSATTILKQIAFWHFDKEGAVMSYDAWIPNLQAWVELSNGVSYSNQDVQNGTINTICSTTQQRCIDANQQYNNTAECVAILRNKPFGTFDEAWGDNVLCRFIHLTLTKVRPEVHCPHVGPVGGNGPNNYKCTNIDYRTEYFDDVELFGGTKGKTFSCKYIDEK